jgi:hypothetical protein
LRTLAERIEEEGPLNARDAVRLAVRLAKTLEAHHAEGGRHGRLSARAIVLPGARVASAMLLRAAKSPESPETRPHGRANARGTTPRDDAYGVAVLLFCALSGKGPEARDASGRFPSMSTLETGDGVDDALSTIVSHALSPDLEGVLKLSTLRGDWEAWLRDSGAEADLERMPWDDQGERSGAKGIDVASLPPPPPQSLKGRADQGPDIEWEAETVDLEAGRETIPGFRKPRIVPPKLRSRLETEDLDDETTVDWGSQAAERTRARRRGRSVAIEALIVLAVAATTIALHRWLIR